MPLNNEHTPATFTFLNVTTLMEHLVHHNPKLKLILARRAFAYRVWVVLAHKVPDSSGRPIRYAVLIEKNYSHLEQGLACIFGNKGCQEAALTLF